MPLMCTSDNTATHIGTSASEDTIVEEHTVEGGDGPDVAACRLDHTQIDGSVTGRE
jgi:hypothetical protein